MAKKTKAAKPKNATPKKKIKLVQQELIPQARHTKLDGLCESIGKINDRRNKLQRDEDADKQAALDYMLKNNIEAYHHSGTELVMRPGAAKLMVRKHKEVSATMSTMDGDEALGE